MLRGRFLAVAGIAALAVVVVVVFALIQFAGDPADDNGLAAPPPGDPNGTPTPGDMPDLDDLDLDDLDLEQPPTPPEVLAFLDAFDVAGSVIHFTIEQEVGEEQVAEGGQTYVRGDVWMEVDDDQAPTRFVGRFFDREGELLRAIYSDDEEEVVALIHETRLAQDPEQSCVHRAPSMSQMLAQSTPFVIGADLLEAEGFTPADDPVQGEPASTEVDDRVGEPVRTVAMPLWTDASQYEHRDAPGRAVVVLDPESGLLIGELALQPGNGEDDGPVDFRQALGDIHVHEFGSADVVFDVQDALDICEQLES